MQSQGGQLPIQLYIRTNAKAIWVFSDLSMNVKEVYVDGIGAARKNRCETHLIVLGMKQHGLTMHEKDARSKQCTTR